MEGTINGVLRVVLGESPNRSQGGAPGIYFQAENHNQQLCSPLSLLTQKQHHCPSDTLLFKRKSPTSTLEISKLAHIM
jgi:hypothetical protein